MALFVRLQLSPCASRSVPIVVWIIQVNASNSSIVKEVFHQRHPLTHIAKPEMLTGPCSPRESPIQKQILSSLSPRSDRHCPWASYLGEFDKRHAETLKNSLNWQRLSSLVVQCHLTPASSSSTGGGSLALVCRSIGDVGWDGLAIAAGQDLTFSQRS